MRVALFGVQNILIPYVPKVPVSWACSQRSQILLYLACFEKPIKLLINQFFVHVRKQLYIKHYQYSVKTLPHNLLYLMCALLKKTEHTDSNSKRDYSQSQKDASHFFFALFLKHGLAVHDSCLGWLQTPGLQWYFCLSLLSDGTAGTCCCTQAVMLSL